MSLQSHGPQVPYRFDAWLRHHKKSRLISDFIQRDESPWYRFGFSPLHRTGSASFCKLIGIIRNQEREGQLFSGDFIDTKEAFNTKSLRSSVVFLVSHPIPMVEIFLFKLFVERLAQAHMDYFDPVNASSVGLVASLHLSRKNAFISKK